MAITSVKKAKLGFEDVHFDTAGNAASAPTLKSDGNFRSVQKINAGHIPLKSETRGKTRIRAATSAATEVDTALGELYDDLLKIGEPDGVSVESVEVTAVGKVIQVKAQGITTAMLDQTGGSEAVTTATIRADNVTNTELATDAVRGSGSGATGDNVIQAASIGPTELGTDCVDGTNIADNAIAGEHVADYAIGKNKLNLDGAGAASSNPGAYIVEMGQHTGITGASSTGNAIGITPVSGDKVFAQMESVTGTNLLLTAKINAGFIDYVFNNSVTGATINYMIVRATA